LYYLAFKKIDSNSWGANANDLYEQVEENSYTIYKKISYAEAVEK